MSGPFPRADRNPEICITGNICLLADFLLVIGNCVVSNYSRRINGSALSNLTGTDCVMSSTYVEIRAQRSNGIAVVFFIAVYVTVLTFLKVFNFATYGFQMVFRLILVFS